MAPTHHLYLASRDELLVLPLTEVAYLAAAGSYTDIFFIDGQQRNVVQCLSDLEHAIVQVFAAQPSTFFRLSRSLLINTSHVYLIDIPHERLLLGRVNPITLHLSKTLLHRLKEHIMQTQKP